MLINFYIKVGESYFESFKYEDFLKASFPGHTQNACVLDYDGITGIESTQDKELAESFTMVSSASTVKMLATLMKYDILKPQNITLEVTND